MGPLDYDIKMHLRNVTKNSLLRSLAQAHIEHGVGYYTCKINDLKILIVK